MYQIITKTPRIGFPKTLLSCLAIHYLNWMLSSAVTIRISESRTQIVERLILLRCGCQSICACSSNNRRYCGKSFKGVASRVSFASQTHQIYMIALPSRELICPAIPLVNTVNNRCKALPG